MSQARNTHSSTDYTHIDTNPIHIVKKRFFNGESWRCSQLQFNLDIDVDAAKIAVQF